MSIKTIRTFFFACALTCALLRAETPGETPKPPEKPADGAAPKTDAPAAPVAPPAPLYQRLGGLAKFADVADVLTERASKNETLNTNEALKKSFASQSRPALRYHVTTALCQICGGTERYTGLPMHELFQELKFSPDQWKAFTTELDQTCDAVKLGLNEKRELLDYAEQIFKFSAETAGRFVKDKGVSLLLPAGYQLTPNPEAPLLLLANGPEPKDGGPRQSILIVADDLMPGIELSAKEYMKANQLSASKQVKTIKNLSAQSLVFNNEPLESFSYNAGAGEGKAEMFVETFFMMRGKRGIAIQFSTPQSEREATRPQFIEALRTLKFE